MLLEEESPAYGIDVRKYQLEHAISEACVLDRASLSKTFAVIADAMTSRIMSATGAAAHCARGSSARTVELADSFGGGRVASD
jgi:hypothetical protein